MERTIKEWLGSIPDEEIRARALANYDPEFAEPGYKTNSLPRAIGGAFDWGISPEGYNFWEIFSDNTLYNLASITFLSLQDLLPEGDHLASHVNDSITEPLNKEIEGLKERLARATAILTTCEAILSSPNPFCTKEDYEQIRNFLNEVN